jgi:hypothetical protein
VVPLKDALHEIAYLFLWISAGHVSLDEILGDAGTASPRNGRVKNRGLRRRLERIETLSKRQKQALLVTLDNFLKGAGVS